MSSSEAEKALKIRREKQLFVSDDLVVSMENVARVVNQPRKYHGNPVLTYDRPWEANCVITWGSVLYDRQKGEFRIWYEVHRRGGKLGKEMFLCYAFSEDGVHWHKPELGLFEYGGSKENNIVFIPPDMRFDSPTVLDDPSERDPEKRYKLFYHTSGLSPRGIYMAHSGDGIHWNPVNDVLVKAGDRNTAYYDTKLKKYRVITRIPGRGIRTCGLWESDDCERWEFVKELLAPDEKDPEDTQLYGMVYFNYESLFLGYLEMFYIPKRKLNAQLIYSTDGYDFFRACERKTFLDWGPEGSWDRAWVFPSHNPPIRIGDELYIFYQGRETLHWSRGPYGVVGSIALSFLRPDGFASLDALDDEGEVLTRALIFEGSTLHINAKAKPGYVAAEFLDEEGQAITGFDRDSCLPMASEDSLDHTIQWKGGGELSALAGRPVRLKFYMRRAKLYSFWFT